MKSAILAILVLVSASAARAAVVGQVYAPDYTCAALQQLVAQGPVGIQMRFGYAIYAADVAACGNAITGQGTVFGTKDQATCDVGVTCDYDGGGNG